MGKEHCLNIIFVSTGNQQNKHIINKAGSNSDNYVSGGRRLDRWPWNSRRERRGCKYIFCPLSMFVLVESTFMIMIISFLELSIF